MATPYSYKTNLFEERKWQGEFFPPNQFEQRFWGEIEYTPEHGVGFTYSIIGNETPQQTEILHGVLDTGERCTLIGKFVAPLSGSRNHQGQSTRWGEVGFQCLLVGDFIEKSDLFKDFRFSLLPMQEFFFPEGWKSMEKYSEKPLVSIPTPYGQLEVGNNASFASLHSKDITAQIYSRNKEALEELDASFKEITQKHKNAHFMLKQDINHQITLKIDNGSSVLEAYSHISDIANLFALLIYSPVYPDSIHIIKEAGELPFPTTIRVYPSLLIDKKTMELCKAERFHHRMPLRRSNIHLAALIDTWLKAPKDYATIISSLQHETGYRSEHSSHGELVLYATQFESISYKNGEKANKYEYPLINYASDKLRNTLAKVFENAGELDIGKGIADLRNEIAHVGKPPKLLSILSLGELMTISTVMHLTIIGYILKSLGISKDLVCAYQDSNCHEQH